MDGWMCVGVHGCMSVCLYECVCVIVFIEAE